MQRVVEVQRLLFDWARQWPRRSPPPEVEKAFVLLVEGHDFDALMETVCGMYLTPHGPEAFSLPSPLQLAAVIASVCVVRPGSDLRGFLTKIDLALDQIGQGGQNSGVATAVMLGLFKAATILDHYACPSTPLVLEESVWKLSLKAAIKLQKHCLVDFMYDGQLSNVISDYLSCSNSDEHHERRSRRYDQTRRALLGLPGLIKESGLLIDDNKFRPLSSLVREMVYKIFGEIPLKDKVDVLVGHLSARIK